MLWQWRAELSSIFCPGFLGTQYVSVGCSSVNGDHNECAQPRPGVGATGLFRNDLHSWAVLTRFTLQHHRAPHTVGPNGPGWEQGSPLSCRNRLKAGC